MRMILIPDMGKVFRSGQAVCFRGGMAAFHPAARKPSMRLSANRPATFALLSLMLVVSACGSDASDSTDASVAASSSASTDASAPAPAVADGDRPVVYASFYPIEEAARAIGGDSVQVESLTPVGVSPHGVELSAEVLEGLENSAAVLYLGRGFQPAVEKAVASLPSSVVRVDMLADRQMLPIDAAVPGLEDDVDGEVLDGGVDPHVWVDPVRFAAMATDIEAAMVALVPADAAAITARAGAHRATIEALDGEFRSGLATCESKAIVTSHRAFGYLANRYGLEQLPIAGISPEEEPSPKSLEAVAVVAKAKGVRVIFFESLVPKELSETVAAEIGVTTDALDPIEGLTQDDLDAGGNYVKIQQNNLASLRKGLRCT